jgi:hypothetical protein
VAFSVWRRAGTRRDILSPFARAHQTFGLNLGWKTTTSRLQKAIGLFSIGRMFWVRTIGLASLVLLLEACSVTEQTPTDVSQKFEEGIKGKGKIVPADKDHSPANVSNDSPVIKPTGAAASQ